MRIKTVEIAGFRGFPRTQVFDLDADAVIVAGANGSGKTSMFDALLWGLTGSIARIQGEAPNLVSMYSPTGEARVALTLVESDGSEIRIVRRFDKREHLTMVSGTDELSGPVAEARLLDILWPDAKFAPEPQAALSRSLTRATCLQQDLVREFVESDSDQERFQVVSELVGVGRVEELQRQLELSRNNWSRATNTIERDVAPLRTQLSGLRQRVSRLGQLDADVASEDNVRRWINEVASMISAEESSQLLADRSAQSLDRALSALEVRQLREERRAAGLERLIDHLRQPVAVPPDPAPIEETERAAEAALQTVAEDLAAAQEQAAQHRREQIEQAEERESMRTLAELALHHLGETCPVCGQTYDEDATRTTLGRLVGSEESRAAMSSDGVAEAAARVEMAERRLAEIRAQVRTARAAREQRTAWEQTLIGLRRDVGMHHSDDTSERAQADAVAARGIADSIRILRSEGERLSVQLARSAETAQRTDLERQVAVLSADLAAREQELASRQATGELASLLLEKLREVNTGIVSTELHRIEPLLQRIRAGRSSPVVPRRQLPHTNGARTRAALDFTW